MKVGQVAYKLELPTEFEAVHPIFHVSMVGLCLSYPLRITPLEVIKVTWDLSYEEVLVAILDRQVRKLWTKEVLCRNNSKEKMTWETKEQMKSTYPHFSKQWEATMR